MKTATRLVVIASGLFGFAAHAQKPSNFAEAPAPSPSAINEANRAEIDASGDPAANLALTNPNVSGGMFTGGIVTGQAATAAGGTYARSLANHFSDFPSPADFLSAGQTEDQLLTGKIDAAPAINAAIAAKGMANLKCGTYVIASTITLVADGNAIIGPTARCVVLYDTRITGDTILVGNGTVIPHNVTIAGVAIYAGAAKTADWALRVVNAWNFQAHNFLIAGTYFGGVSLEGNNGGPPGFGYRLTDFEIQTASGAPCLSVSKFAQDVYLLNGLIGTAPGASCSTGIDLHSVGGFYATQIDVLGASGTGMLINPSAARNENVFAVYLTHVLSDTSQGDNIAFAGDGPINEVHMGTVWASSSQHGHGVVNSNASLDGLVASDLETIGNNQDGILLSAGKNIQFLGVRSIMNNVSNAGNYSGISITAGDQITITGAKLGGGGVYTAAINAGAGPASTPPHVPAVVHQAYGAVIDPAVTNLIFMGNQAGGNVKGGCLLPSASATIIRVNNIGSGC
jgi:hypothetical protein